MQKPAAAFELEGDVFGRLIKAGIIKQTKTKVNEMNKKVQISDTEGQ